MNYTKVKLTIYTSLILVALSCSSIHIQQSETIKISCEIDDTIQNLSDNFLIYFINNKDSLKGVTNKNSITLPNLKDSMYTILFSYKKYNLLFDSVLTQMILPNNTMGLGLKFGIDNYPFNTTLGLLKPDEYEKDSKTKELYYLLFEPYYRDKEKEGAEIDGIIIVKKK